VAGPYADIREYLVVHQSLRVTLDRFVSATDRLEPAQLAAVVGDRWALFARGLHHHHEEEDDAFFPAIAAAAPDVKPLIEQLVHEHEELVARLDAVDRAVVSLTAEPTEQNKKVLHDAIAEVRDQLVPHLDIEDAKLLPAAAQSVDSKEWARLSKEAMQSLPKSDLPIVAGILDEVVRGLPVDQRPPPPPLPIRVLVAVSWRKRYAKFVEPLMV
jgi:hemerythrin-like domain-containing protein